MVPEAGAELVGERSGWRSIDRTVGDRRPGEREIGRGGVAQEDVPRGLSAKGQLTGRDHVFMFRKNRQSTAGGAVADVPADGARSARMDHRKERRGDIA